jgi:hypothetical protein
MVAGYGIVPALKIKKKRKIEIGCIRACAKPHEMQRQKWSKIHPILSAQKIHSGVMGKGRPIEFQILDRRYGRCLMELFSLVWPSGILQAVFCVHGCPSTDCMHAFQILKTLIKQKQVGRRHGWCQNGQAQESRLIMIHQWMDGWPGVKREPDQDKHPRIPPHTHLIMPAVQLTRRGGLVICQLKMKMHVHMRAMVN